MAGKLKPSTQNLRTQNLIPNMTFNNIFAQYSWDDVKASIYQKTARDVEHALNKTGVRDLEDFKPS